MAYQSLWLHQSSGTLKLRGTLKALNPTGERGQLFEDHEGEGFAPKQVLTQPERVSDRTYKMGCAHRDRFGDNLGSCSTFLVGTPTSIQVP